MLGLTKAERLVSGSSFMTHAMVFTGMNVEVNDNGVSQAKYLNNAQV